MNKQERYELYKGSVGPGWWPILDQYIPQILARDPECKPYIKEKFGYLRIEFYSDRIDLQEQIDIENAAELASSTVCEFCGQRGYIRTQRLWMQTLCNRCNKLDSLALRSVAQEAEQRWLDKEEKE